MSMDEKELNEAICNIMFWYKDTPMAIPQKIVELIIKDRKRICEPLVKAKNLLYGVLCDPEGTVCISGSNGDEIEKRECPDCRVRRIIKQNDEQRTMRKII